MTAVPDPVATCREKAAPPGSSLHYALLFAPPAQRGDLLALHALHREITEIVDECSDPGVAAVKLNWWRDELGRMFAGEARHPVAIAMQGALHRHELDRELLEQLIEGVSMDLEYGSYPSFRELTVYCHHVGCSLAHLAATICGYSDSATPRYAHDLGMALQLTGMLRNVRRHAAAGRVYIPEDELQAAGVDRETLAGGNSDERTRRLFAEQAERARRFFDSAMERLPAADRRQQRPGVVLASLYASLLDEMARDGYPLLERRYHLTPLRKLWLAWRATKRPGRRKSANQTETPQ